MKDICLQFSKVDQSFSVSEYGMLQIIKFNIL